VKNMVKLFGIIAFMAVIGFTMLACPEPDEGGNNKKGKDDPSVKDVTISISHISVTAVPVYGEHPDFTVVATDQFTGTIVSWKKGTDQIVSADTFIEHTEYTAEILLTPKSGFTLKGVPQNFFTVVMAESTTNAADSGTVYATFPETGGSASNPTTINIQRIEGVTPPVRGATAVSTIDETTQFTGTVVWRGKKEGSDDDTANGTFKGGYVYTAQINLTAKTGFTFDHVPADFFSVPYSQNTKNNAGLTTMMYVFATFPETEAEPTYGISISNEADYTFSSDVAGYSAITPLTITVNNNGNRPTPVGAITITKSESQVTEGFTLSTGSISNIPVNGSDTFTITPKTGLAAGSYKAMIQVTYTVNSTGIFQKYFYVNFTVVSNVYIINGSSGSFTATQGDTTIGTANQPINTVIGAIRANANGAPAVIQFGDGSTALDVGSEKVSFSNLSVTPAWGAVTLRGKITSSNSETDGAVIFINGGLYVTSSADVTNTGTGSAFLTNSFANEPSTLNITGGTVSSSADTVSIYAQGDLNITGTNANPIIKTTSSNNTNNAAVRVRDGNTNISGGNIQGTVWGEAKGLINVSGNAKINQPGNNNGGIYLSSTRSSYGVSLNITGGLIESDTNFTRNAITNDSNGAITISGGTVSVTSSSGGNAIENKSTGSIRISGGTIKTTGTGSAVKNDSNGAITISGGAVSTTNSASPAVWNAALGTVTVSGTASITSAVTDVTKGTIYLIHDGNGENYNSTRLEILGGTVTNTADSADANTILSKSLDGVVISGGTVTAAKGTAVYAAVAGNTTIIGGTVSATSGKAVYNSSGGRVLVSADGAVSVTTGVAITNVSGGRVWIEDGEVSATTGYGIAVNNKGAGDVMISGGTVSSTTFVAVSNDGTGCVYVSGGTVTSANTDQTKGTISISNDTGLSTAAKLNIYGGLVKNTSASGVAVYNDGVGEIIIRNSAHVETTGATAITILNDSTGTLTILDGLVMASGITTAKVIKNTNGGTVTIKIPPATIVGIIDGPHTFIE